jgi:HK97 family phage major capsid protein
MVDISRATSGVNLPPDVSGEIWANTLESSAVMQAARRIALPGSGVSIPVITGEAEADWVAETEEKPVSRPTLANKTITPYKLAVIVPFSDEFRRDLPALYAELVRRLPASLGKKFDETVFAASGAPGSNFDQLGGADALIVDGTDTYADLVAVYNAIAAEGGDLSAWLARPELQGLLLSATDGFGRPLFTPDATTSNRVGSMLGRPIFGTRATMVTGDTGIAGDFAGSAVYGTVEGVQISFSDQATLTDGAGTINLWQQNMFAVRAEIEVGFRVRNLEHFKRIRAAA